MRAIGQELAAIWLAEVGGREGSGAPDLAAGLKALVQAGRAAWPDIELDDGEFVRHVAKRASDGDLAGVRAAELYLACACTLGHAGAVARMEERFLAPLDGQLRRTRHPRERIADALQTLRTRLLVDGKIGDYSGRGSLEGWLRVAATRTLLNMAEKEQHERPTPDPEVEDALLAKVDPELEVIKARYSEDFHAAFRAALATLSPEERNLLRMTVIDGLNGAEIGSLRHVHRTTVTRWIGDIRSKILAETRRGLAARLETPTGELDSVLGIFCSQLEQSLHKFLVG